MPERAWQGGPEVAADARPVIAHLGPVVRLPGGDGGLCGCALLGAAAASPGTPSHADPTATRRALQLGRGSLHPARPHADAGDPRDPRLEFLEESKGLEGANISVTVGNQTATMTTVANGVFKALAE